MRRRTTIGLYAIVFWMIAAPVYAETEADCKAALTGQLKVVEDEATREWHACHDEHECVVRMQNKRSVARQQIVDHYKACRDRALGQTVIHWKPGDPSPVAPDGRRYIMSCSGKVLGLYKPGGALEMELKTHPGNCMPLDNWGPGGFGPSTGNSSGGRCWDAGAKMYRDYSGSLPSGCDPNR